MGSLVSWSFLQPPAKTVPCPLSPGKGDGDNSGQLEVQGHLERDAWRRERRIHFGRRE